MHQHDNQLDDQQSKVSASLPETARDASLQLSQEEMHKLYLEQQRRLACPGCGEEPFLG